MTRKTIFYSIFILINLTFAFGMPVDPGMIRQIHCGGKEILIRQWGDEFAHGYETLDGYTIIQMGQDDLWSYAVLDEKGVLIPSPYIVGRDDPVLCKIERHIRPKWDNMREEKKSIFGKTTDRLKEQAAYEGDFHVLTIFIDFPDQPHIFNVEDFQQFLFSVDPENPRSMADYYNEVSYGEFHVIGDTVGWYTAKNEKAYYGANTDSGSDDFAKVRELVIEAVTAADPYVDFSKYDNDKDGEVDAVNIFHSGRGEETGGCEDDIWAYMYFLDRSYKTNDSVTIHSYTIQPELYLDDITSIGIFCHEFGHVLGLPDLYDYDDSSSGIGSFCLMSYGGHNTAFGKKMDCPGHFCAWSKACLGWVDVSEITRTDEYRLNPAETDAFCYKVKREIPDGEYFLIENRQKVGFDRGLPGETGGVLIWHIDGYISDNNDDSCRLVDLEQAQPVQTFDLSYENRGSDEDYFREGKEFTQTSNPDSRSYLKFPSGISIMDFKEMEADKSYTFNVGIYPNGYSAEKWNLNLGDYTQSPIFVTSNGSVYIKDTNGDLLAIDPAGNIKWKFSLNPFFRHAIGKDGSVYLISIDDYLQALNPDGTEKWQISMEFDHTYTGIIKAGPDGTIYTTSNKNLYAISPDGSIKWQLFVYYNPADIIFGKDGTLYVTPGSAFIFAYTPEGEEKWNKAFEGFGCLLAKNTGIDDTIYFYSKKDYNSDDGYIYAVKKDGSIKWRYDVGANVDPDIVVDVNSAPLAAEDGTVYFLYKRDSALCALDPGGNFKWEFHAIFSMFSPSLGLDGTIYVGGSYSDYLYALNPDGKGRWARKFDDAVLTTNAGSPDGTVYVMTFDGYLHAIKENKWIETRLHIEPDKAVFNTGDNIRLLLDIYTYADDVNTDIWLVMLDPAQNIYFALAWNSTPAPVIANIFFPSGFTLPKTTLSTFNVPNTLPPISTAGTYIFAVGLAELGTTNFFHISTAQFEVIP